MYTYSAYGYGIVSEIQLPELSAAEKPPDVRIHFGKVDRTAPPGAQRGVTFWTTPEKTCLAYDEIGAFMIQFGKEITVDPKPGVEERVLRLQILGPALAILLHQRGFLVLHASAVAAGNGAIAFLGATQWGKSTMAAVFHARGYALVADDYVAVELDKAGFAQIQPGFPQMKLWPDAAEALGEAIEEMPRLHPGLEKRAHRIVERFQADPVPLRRVYVLADGDRHEIESLSPQEALIELVRHSYAARLLEGTNTTVTHFRQCASLVRTRAVRRLRRPRSLESLPDLARLVEDDLAANG